MDKDVLHQILGFHESQCESCPTQCDGTTEGSHLRVLELAWLQGYKFILSKIYFLLILGVFITGQSALLNHKMGEGQTLAEDITMFTCRIFNYIFSMCKLIISDLAGDPGRKLRMPPRKLC